MVHSRDKLFPGMAPGQSHATSVNIPDHYPSESSQSHSIHASCSSYPLYNSLHHTMYM